MTSFPLFLHLALKALWFFQMTKVEYSSQGDSLLPIQEPNPPSILHDLAIGDKVEESVEAISCHDKSQNNLGAQQPILGRKRG